MVMNPSDQARWYRKYPFGFEAQNYVTHRFQVLHRELTLTKGQ
jgi:hypothetical protein